MAIAFGRIGRFKRFIISSIVGTIVFLKNKVIELVTGRQINLYEEDMLDGYDEKGYQGENGDIRNRDGVKINHIDIPMGDLDKKYSSYADSSIGEGMDITIQGGGANGHLKGKY